MMFSFYHAVLESIIRYGMTAWFGSLSVHVKSKLQRLVQGAMKVLGRTETLPHRVVYEQCVHRQAQRVLLDPSEIELFW